MDWVSVSVTFLLKDGSRDQKIRDLVEPRTGTGFLLHFAGRVSLSFASIKCTHLNNLNMEVSFAHSWKINTILIKNTDLQNTKKMIT